MTYEEPTWLNDAPEPQEPPTVEEIIDSLNMDYRAMLPDAPKYTADVPTDEDRDVYFQVLDTDDDEPDEPLVTYSYYGDDDDEDDEEEEFTLSLDFDEDDDYEFDGYTDEDNA